MIELLVLTFGFLGLLAVCKGQQSDAPVYEDTALYAPPADTLSGFHDDAQLRQFRRRER
jgi:hypothetical protein